MSQCEVNRRHLILTGQLSEEIELFLFLIIIIDYYTTLYISILIKFKTKRKDGRELSNCELA